MTQQTPRPGDDKPTDPAKPTEPGQQPPPNDPNQR